jgi:hypothetical protein
MESWALLAAYFHAGSLLGLFIDPEDGGDMFFPNVGRFSTDYTALYSYLILFLLIEHNSELRPVCY